MRNWLITKLDLKTYNTRTGTIQSSESRDKCKNSTGGEMIYQDEKKRKPRLYVRNETLNSAFNEKCASSVYSLIIGIKLFTFHASKVARNKH